MTSWRHEPASGREHSHHRAGQVFWVPAGSTWLNQDKPRPFVLTTPSQPGALGSLAYGSTQQTEMSAGAACVEVAPMREGLNRNGLRARTWFYPGTLLPVWHERLPRHSGFVGKSALGELRAALRVALGIGRGACLAPHAPAGSCRGRVVVLGADIIRDIHAAYAVVLTEPRYSAERNHQILLPFFTSFARRAEKYDLIISRRDQPSGLPTTVDRVLLPIPLTQSVWHEDDIAHETAYVLDDESLTQIDRMLCDYFSLDLLDTDSDAVG